MVQWYRTDREEQEVDVLEVARPLEKGSRTMHNALYRAQDVINGARIVAPVLAALLKDETVRARVAQLTARDFRPEGESLEYIEMTNLRIINTLAKFGEEA